LTIRNPPGNFLREEVPFMQIAISGEAEELVRSAAADAGYQDVSQYVVTLVQEDHAQREFLQSLAADPRLEKLALEGLASGPAVPLDMAAIRREVRDRLEHGRP
jgi:hypothetical protein